MFDVKWIKLSTDIFNNRKIRVIETMPDGYAIIVVWVKLLCLAGTTNDGGQIYLTTNIPYTEQTLSAQFNMPLATVKLALATFEKLEMIERVDDFLKITNWEKYQNVQGLEKVREQTRNRVARYRQRQKSLPECTPDNVTLHVTQCNATDKDIDKDIDIDIDNNILSVSYSEIIDYLNEKADTKYRATGKKTQSLIKARLNEGFTVEDFKTVIDNQCSKWLNDNKMQDYLRPETLFGTKFESYLNSKPKGSVNNGTVKNDKYGDIGTIL